VVLDPPGAHALADAVAVGREALRRVLEARAKLEEPRHRQGGEPGRAAGVALDALPVAADLDLLEADALVDDHLNDDAVVREGVAAPETLVGLAAARRRIRERGHAHEGAAQDGKQDAGKRGGQVETLPAHRLSVLGWGGWT